MSIDVDQCNKTTAYDKSLKEFLRPSVEALQKNDNEHSNKLKTYAQVLRVSKDLE